MDYTYTRRKTAPGEADFQLEWSISLDGGWSPTSAIASETITDTPPDTQTVKVSVSTGTHTKFFVRLKVSQP